MNFSSLVLMERDKETGNFVRELESYSVGDGAEYISKIYAIENTVYLYFDTAIDVEEWQYTAIYDFFQENVFSSKGFLIDSIDDEYNPTWKITFPFNEDYTIVHSKINLICDLILGEMKRVFEEIKDKEEEYK